MATTFSSGGQSTNSHHRTIERVFEDAQHTGEINLSGRKLREYPKIASKFDLVDTSVAGKFHFVILCPKIFLSSCTVAISDE